jgi:hypothetical protein
VRVGIVALELEDGADACTAEAVDRLIVVTDDERLPVRSRDVPIS